MIGLRKIVPVLAIVLFALSHAAAQNCQMADAVDGPTRSALESTTNQYFGMFARGDAQLSSIATPAVTNLPTLSNDHKANLAGATPKMRWIFVLDNTATKPGERADFYCGVFNSPDRVMFSFGQLPNQRFSVIVQDADGGKVPYQITWVLQQTGTQWKVAGIFPKPHTYNGHNGLWYWTEARRYKTANKPHNAYFYYLLADELLRPFPVIATQGLDKLAAEVLDAQPADLPSEQPMQLTAAGGKTYTITNMFPLVVDDKPNVVVKFSVPDVSNTAQAFQDNTAVIKALVTKYPELREAFNAIVARATAPSGQDYGTLLAMKDIN